MPHRGTSKAYILERLRREEGLSYVADAIEAGRISSHAVGLELGWIGRPDLVGVRDGQAKQRHFLFQRLLREAASRAIAKASDIDSCGLTLSELQELWLGAHPTTGSHFRSREELVAAWEAGRAVVMRLWGSHGRRPMAWWEFDAGDLKHPGYDRERSTLWRAGVLSESERTELEAEWRREFEHAHRPDFFISTSGEVLHGDAAVQAHLAWADVPIELAQRWAAARRRRGRHEAPSEEAVVAK